MDIEAIVPTSSEDKAVWAAMVASLLRAARDLGTLAMLAEPSLVELTPEHEPARWQVVLLPAEQIVRIYLGLPTTDGEPRRMAHAGDLLADGTWRSATMPMSDGPAH